MIEENFFVPYQTGDLPAGPWLVLAPHADDETFGMGGTLLRARSEGVQVHVLIMTDGALGGSSEGLVATRQQEAEAVAKRLSLESLEFLGEPDRGLECVVSLSSKLSTLIVKKQVATVFFPGMFEPHPDHRATALLAWDALSRIPLQERPRAAAYEISVQNPINCLIDISLQMQEKHELMALYLSQSAENNYAEVVEAMNKLRTFSMPKHVNFAEGFYLFSQQESQSDLLELMQTRVSLFFD